MYQKDTPALLFYCNLKKLNKKCSCLVLGVSHSNINKVCVCARVCEEPFAISPSFLNKTHFYLHYTVVEER